MALPKLRVQGLGLLVIPVLILPVVALNQARMHADSGLSSWRGGGFGMFATVDRDYYRAFQVTVRSKDGTELKLDWSVVENYLNGDVDRKETYSDARSLPSPERLAAVAELLATRTWQQNNGQVQILSQGNGMHFRAKDFIIKVYGVTYDRTMNRVTPELLATWSGDAR
jgi:hypothetical protein